MPFYRLDDVALNDLWNSVPEGSILLMEDLCVILLHQSAATAKKVITSETARLQAESPMRQKRGQTNGARQSRGRRMEKSPPHCLAYRLPGFSIVLTGSALNQAPSYLPPRTSFATACIRTSMLNATSSQESCRPSRSRSAETWSYGCPSGV